MSLFSEPLPKWENAGVEPLDAKKTAGWDANEKPPADWFNWLFNRSYKCIDEIRTVITNMYYTPGDTKTSFKSTADTGWLKANGAAVLVSSYSTLATNIYCGDTNNATADWGYKCTDPLNPSTTRSTSGSYITLPDARGEHFRGFDDGRGVDTGRNLYRKQADSLKLHKHDGTALSAGDHRHRWGHTNQPVFYPYDTVPVTAKDPALGGDSTTMAYTENSGAHPHTLSIDNAGDAETRGRNLAVCVYIKY